MASSSTQILLTASLAVVSSGFMQLIALKTCPCSACANALGTSGAGSSRTLDEDDPEVIYFKVKMR